LTAGDVHAGNPLPITAASLPLPTGAATAALQLPDSHNVTVDNTIGVPANVQIGDGTRTATVRDTGASDSLNVAIVDAAGAQITSFGGGTQYVEDDASAANPTGNQLIARRRDTPAAETTTDGDATALNCTTEGSLHVELRSGTAETGVAALPLRVDPTGTTTQPISAASLPLPTGAATSALQLPNSHDVTIDNAGAGAAVNIQDGGNSITIDGSVGITGSVDTELPAAVALSADNVVSPTAPAVGAFAHAFDGTNWDRVRGDSTDGLLVNLGANNDVIQATASNLNAQVVGNIAHDTGDAGNPVKVGGVARTANPTAVAAGDRADVFMDVRGRLVVTNDAPRERRVVGRLALTTTTETTLIALGGAGVFRDLSMLLLSNESATEVRVDIRDATAGTPVISFDLAPDGGGAVMPFPVPLPQATANNNWTAQLSAAVSTVYITAIAIEA